MEAGTRRRNETLETKVVLNGVEGFHVDLNVKDNMDEGKSKITNVKVVCQEKV